ncbi:hypothetical protein AB0K00_46955 [Dactylosporangium sp. NPDC049525]|uniref:DUF7919 family protein n=1 Tax=Dactylosporangium sp. NPDC049525 TaxID=3154730 RepID=UPI003424D670
MEYPDLSPYMYRQFPLDMRTVGWLGRERGLQDSNVPVTDADLHRLRAASLGPTNLTRGWHDCEWCGSSPVSEGNGEYHYYAHDGEVYAAPAMIFHYVEVHGYRPPAVFLESLRVTGTLAWDWRAERLAAMFADDPQDMDSCRTGIVDLAHWKDPKALEALLVAARNPRLVLVAGEQLGGSLARFVSCDFAPDLTAETFPGPVRQGMDKALRRR